MDFNMETLLPYIPFSEYDTVATDFLEKFSLPIRKNKPLLRIAFSEIILSVQNSKPFFGRYGFVFPKCLKRAGFCVKPKTRRILGLVSL